MLKDCFHALKKTFLIGTLKKLCISSITVREWDIKILAIICYVIFNEPGFAKINLSFTRWMIQSDRAFLYLAEFFSKLCNKIPYCAITCIKFRVEFPQSIVYSFGCISLLVWGPFVILKPFHCFIPVR